MAAVGKASFLTFELFRLRVQPVTKTQRATIMTAGMPIVVAGVKSILFSHTG
jgi:hypothetical protein